MSEKDNLDQYIDKLTSVKKENLLNETLDSIIDKLVSERIPLVADKKPSKEDRLYIEALDSYSTDLIREQTYHSLSEASQPKMSNRARAEKIILSLPKMSINEQWGDPTSQTRVEIKRFSDNIDGKTIQSKFDNFMRIQQPDNRITSQTRILSSLIMLESLRSLIKTANASSAGFAFEGFIAALMNGSQVSEPKDGSLPIEDVMLFTYEDSNASAQANATPVPVSLKLLQEKGGVKGSYTNMMDALFGDSPYKNGVPYIVAYKTPNASRPKINEASDGASKTEDLSLVIYEFIFSPENVFNVLRAGGAKASNADSMLLNKKRVELLSKAFNAADKRKLRKFSSNWEKLLSNPPTEDDVFRKMLACTQGYSIDKFKNLLARESPSGVGTRTPVPSPIQEATDGDNGHQWLINSSFFRSDRENAKLIGSLDISTEAIYQTAETYIEILQDGIATLFQATADLSEGINTYFVAKKRDTGLSAGRNAIQHASTIRKVMKKQMKD